MLRRGVIAILLVLSNVALSEVVGARERPTYFIVDNNDTRPVRVWMRPSGAENWEWGLTIAPGGSGRFRLRGYNAVDVLVVRRDDSALYFPKAPLRSLIRNTPGTSPRILEAREGRIIRSDGQARLALETSCSCAPSAELNQCRPVAKVKATSSSVTLSDLRLICKEVDDPNPPPPPPPTPTQVPRTTKS